MRKRKAVNVPAKVTPGPYAIIDNGHGFHVTGKSGVFIAWASDACVIPGHFITMQEAKANAELILRAFEEQEKKGSST